jgi:hypothetical protein
LGTDTEDPDEIALRDKCLIWKLKANVGKVCYHILSRYGKTQYAEEWNGELSEQTMIQIGHIILEANLQLLFRKINQKAFVGTEALGYALKVVTSCSKIKPIMENLLKPFVGSLLCEVAVPVLILSQAEIEKFVDEPIDFVRDNIDNVRNLHPRRCMLELIAQLCIEYNPSGD